MTGPEPSHEARLLTVHDDPAAVAAALRPDNTAEMRTEVDGDRVRTRIDREGASGLRRTVDDYLVNLRVAKRILAAAEGSSADEPTETHDT